MSDPKAAFAEWFELLDGSLGTVSMGNVSLGTVSTGTVSTGSDSMGDVDVFTFPYSGSGVAMFAPWRRQLGPNINLFATKLPGRESRLKETPRRELLPLAEELAETIAAAGRSTRSTALIGFSLGAVLAFEVARSLRQRSRQIDLLVAAAARAPQGRWPRGRLHRLKDDRFIAELNARYAAIPPAIAADPQARALLLPMLRGDIEMFETYDYRDQEPLSCEILTLAGTDDPKVKRKHISPWRQLTSRYRHRSFAGDHYFAKTSRGPVVETLRRRLQRLRRERAES